MRTYMTQLFLVVAALMAIAGCTRTSKIDLDPHVNLVPLKDEGPRPRQGGSWLTAGTDTVLSGATTNPTMSEVLERIEAALEGKVHRGEDRWMLNYRQSIFYGGASLMASRDPADLTGGSVFAITQLVYGACGSLSEAVLLSDFGINIRGTIDANAAVLKAFGLRLLSNTTLITATTAPALYAEAGKIFEAQIAKLKASPYSGRFPTEAAAQSICVAAIHAGAFRSGS
jgi:hypothetical protein